MKAQKKGKYFYRKGMWNWKEVKLINEERKESLQGELLLWRGKEEKFELKKAQFAGQGIEANCQLVVYNIRRNYGWRTM